MSKAPDIIELTGKVVGNEQVARRFVDLNSSVRLRARDIVYGLGAEVRGRAAQAAPKGKTGELGSTMGLFLKENPKGIYALIYPTARARSDREKYGFVLSAGVSARVLKYDMKVRRTTVGTKITYSAGGTASVSQTRRRLRVSTRVRRRFAIAPRGYMREAGSGYDRRLEAEIERMLSEEIDASGS